MLISMMNTRTQFGRSDTKYRVIIIIIIITIAVAAMVAVGGGGGILMAVYNG